MKDVTIQGDIVVRLEREGEGRYVARLCRPSKGAVRIGLVLGGFRTWTGEPIGKAAPVNGTSRTGVARELGTWALTQPGGRHLAA